MKSDLIIYPGIHVYHAIHERCTHYIYIGLMRVKRRGLGYRRGAVISLPMGDDVVTDYLLVRAFA